MHPSHAPGHELVQGAGTVGRKCDYCGSIITGKAWACRPCDYSLCKECHDCPRTKLWERLLLHSKDPPWTVQQREATQEELQGEIQAAVDAGDKVEARFNKLMDD
eukprot:COSAG05_NODE_18152_length_313_cov_0.481308_1_plen_104_part_11